MSKKRRKTDKCLNCGYQLEPSFDYCPHCGQENNDRQISFGKLIADFFSNYFSLDSKFGRSIKPFFIQPGVLTKEFMDGKRVKYANPIRLYLVISLIHFFFFNLNMDRETESNGGIIQMTSDETDSDSTETKSDTVAIKSSKKKKVDSVIENDDSFFISGEEWNVISKMSQDKAADYSIQQIEDSIHNERKPMIARFLTYKLIKLMKSDLHSINMYVISKIPLAMFFLLPIYALILKIFFRKRLYINHLIHSLHLHSFAFFTLSILWIINLISSSVADDIEVFFILTIAAYIVFSFKNTYSIKLGSSIWKVLLSGFIYLIILVFTLIFGVLLSLIFY